MAALQESIFGGILLLPDTFLSEEEVTMIYESDKDREEQEEEFAEESRHIRVTRAPAPAPEEHIRPAWLGCAFDDLRPFGAPPAGAEQPENEGGDVWYFRPDDDLPGDAVAKAEIRTADGKIIEAYGIMDLATDLKKACPVAFLQMSLWMTAAAMDPRSPGALN
jgi:hypothetical protein